MKNLAFKFSKNFWVVIRIPTAGGVAPGRRLLVISAPTFKPWRRLCAKRPLFQSQLTRAIYCIGIDFYTYGIPYAHPLPLTVFSRDIYTPM
jgi:hypothetical protein